MRIEKTRRTARARRYADEAFGLRDVLDPRDPDIVRAKRLALEVFAPLDGTEALAEQDKFQPSLIEQAKYEGKTY
ncbi:hypothetical protein, partial [Streptomyces olindensis]|uniref:hypothetical protein n=1 Tax=Streptomyces olindensis TaxID=358823 RepID=UPI0033E73127